MLLGERRLRSVLAKHGIALSRTLEQKISDAGPGHMRVDPHVLTKSLKSLKNRGEIKRLTRDSVNWHYLADTPQDFVEKRLQEQLPVYQKLNEGSLSKRVGQCLEIAIYRALASQQLDFFGRFPNLYHHEGSRLLSKEEPPGHIGSRSLPGQQRLDFLFRHPSAGWAAIEAKNIREWFYPDRKEVRELLSKSIALDCVPVLIARRYSFVAFKVLSMCGVVFHENFNQMFAKADTTVALDARNKRLLGYHDIRIGDHPDARLQKFIHTNLPNVLPAARERFEKFKDLLAPFADGSMEYQEFAGRARRRASGVDEDADWIVDDETY